MMDRRSALPLVPGVIGLVLGIVAAVADVPALAVVAGLCALAAALLVNAAKPERALAAAAAPAAAPARPQTSAEAAVAAAAGLAESVQRAAAPVVPADPTPVGDQRADTPSASSPAAGPAAPAGSTSATSATGATGATGDAGADEAAASPSGERGLIDLETGLFNEDFFKVAVETRVSAARRHLRPVAIVLFDVVDDLNSGAPHRVDPEPVATAIKATLREADIACRLDDGRYAFVLEDTPEDGAIWTIERLRRTLTSIADTNQVRWAGVACYPAHAFSASEALQKAERAYASARDWAQDRIEVASSD